MLRQDRRLDIPMPSRACQPTTRVLTSNQFAKPEADVFLAVAMRILLCRPLHSDGDTITACPQTGERHGVPGTHRQRQSTTLR